MKPTRAQSPHAQTQKHHPQGPNPQRSTRPAPRPVVGAAERAAHPHARGQDQPRFAPQAQAGEPPVSVH